MLRALLLACATSGALASKGEIDMKCADSCPRTPETCAELEQMIARKLKAGGGGCAHECKMQDIQAIWGDAMPTGCNTEAADRYTLVISFQASGDISDYDVWSEKKPILEVLVQAAGLGDGNWDLEIYGGAKGIRNAWLGAVAGSVHITSGLKMANRAASETASAAFKSAVTSAADLTKLMKDAGVDITIESTPTTEISHDNDGGCTGGTGIGEECGFQALPVILPVAGVLVMILLWLSGALAPKTGPIPGCPSPLPEKYVCFFKHLHKPKTPAGTGAGTQNV